MPSNKLSNKKMNPGKPDICIPPWKLPPVVPPPPPPPPTCPPDAITGHVLADDPYALPGYGHWDADYEALFDHSEADHHFYFHTEGANQITIELVEGPPTLAGFIVNLENGYPDPTTFYDFNDPWTWCTHQSFTIDEWDELYWPPATCTLTAIW